MMTKKTLTLGVLALVGAAFTSTGWAQKTKAGGDAIMAEAARAVELAQQGAHDEAIKIFTTVIEARPKDSRLYNDRGGVYLTTRRFPEAEADFTKAIELAPKDYAGYSLRGAARVELNKLDEAMEDLNKALELKADEPRTLERRGLAYYKQKNYDAAIADYNKALEMHAKASPAPTPATAATAGEGASPAPDAAPAVNPASTLALSRRADAYFAKQQFAEAQADLQTYLKIRPEDFNAEERLRVVNAKLNPAAAPVAAAAPKASPTPKPVKLLTRANVLIAVGGLLVLGILVVLIAKMAMTRGT